MRFEFFVDHRVVAEVAPQVDESCRLHVSVSLPDPGKYHVDVEILGESGELTPFGFDICVGADPDRAPEEFERLCPSMNAH